MDNSIHFQVSLPTNATLYHGSNLSSVPGIHFGDILTQILSLINIWRFLVVVLIVANFKNFPLIWHLRIVNAFRFTLKTQRPKIRVTSKHIFQPIITNSHTSMMETDLNLHKSNSSYFSDIDIARTHLICTLFSKGIEHFRGGTGTLPGSKRPIFGLALGAVSCSFAKELKPYEKYEIWTRVLSWDEKWIYIVTHFVRKGAVMPRKYTLYPQQNGVAQEDEKRRDSTSSVDSMSSISSASSIDSMVGHPAVVATALNKCVFKQGRRTISPALMLKQSGLLPAKSLDDVLAHEIQPVTMPSCSSSDSGIDDCDNQDETELEAIERERQRGMLVAASLSGQSQSALMMEFTADTEALGKHRDGTGLTGVVSTLAQLAHLKKNQIL